MGVALKWVWSNKIQRGMNLHPEAVALPFVATPWLHPHKLLIARASVHFVPAPLALLKRGREPPPLRRMTLGGGGYRAEELAITAAEELAITAAGPYLDAE